MSKKHFVFRLGKSLYPDGIERTIQTELTQHGRVFRFLTYTDTEIMHSATFATNKFLIKGEIVRIPYWLAQREGILDYS